jgi:hypothetical protein
MRVGEMNKNLKQMIEWMREDFRFTCVDRLNVDDHTIRFVVCGCEFIVSFSDEDNWCGAQGWYDTPHKFGGNDLGDGQFSRELYVKIMFDILDYILAGKYGNHLSKFAVLDGNKVVFTCTDMDEAEVRKEYPNYTLVEVRRSDSLEQAKRRFPDWDWSAILNER